MYSAVHLHGTAGPAWTTIAAIGHAAALSSRLTDGEAVHVMVTLVEAVGTRS